MNQKLEFKGGWGMSFVPVFVFFLFCILLFIVFLSYDMHALAMGGIVGLLIGALFAKNYSRYWESVIKGIASKNSITIVLILLIVGMFSQMIKDSGASEGFIWIAHEVGMTGGIYVAFTFFACSIIATATGSSIGTMFAAFPIFYTAGVALGADPAMLAGAITSGCIFGDNLAPVSDTTIASASTQRFKDRKTPADIAGVVMSRARYSLVAGVIALVLFALLGGGGEIAGGIEMMGDPSKLVMLIPVAILLIVAVKTRDIFKALTVGLLTGIVTGLIFGIFTPASIFSSSGELGNHVTGFLPTGLESMLGTVALVISVFGMVGVLQEAGSLERIIDKIVNSKLGRSTKGTEMVIALGSCITCSFFGGVTSAAILSYGPVIDEVGRSRNIHPYRRSNLLDGFVNSIPVVIPFLSVFVFITVALSGLNPVEVAIGMLYPSVLFVVLMFAVLSGWGLRYEGENGEQLRTEAVVVTEKRKAL
jgi:Na+/H+ antiporter NhaC